MSDILRDSLRSVLNPKSVAVIGASENANKIGGRPILYLSRHGFKGAVYPINPKRSEILGYKAYPSLADLPDAPEAAIVALAGDAAIEAVEQCAARGVRTTVVMSSGFGETDPVGGKAKEKRMRDAAHKAGMRVVGPNSQGLANFGTGAILSFSTMYIEAPPMDGPVAVVSQSGAMSVVPYGLLRSRGIGVRHSHATGNDSDVTAAELASVVAEDPDLKLLLLYLESITDPYFLAETARIAHSRNLPVIALKSGRTAAGQEAARSHTGALANEDRVVDAFFAQHGIWRARDTAELVASAEMYLKGWKPRGRRLVAISNSGAVCVMAADAATSVGMPLAKLAVETRSELGRILPGFATTTNPVDITAALLTNSGLFSQILPVIARDSAADAFLIGIPVAGQGYDVEAFARDSADFAKATGKPLVAAIPQPGIGAKFKAHGLPVFPTEYEAVAALNQFLSHHELMAAARGRVLHSDHAPQPQAPAPMLNEADSLALLQKAGVPVVPHRLCRSAAEAAAALAALGGPVAVKGCSADVAHKSELGLVRLGLADAAAVRTAFADMEAALNKAGARFDGAIVARMARGRRELMIGARVDPVFGPVVLVGDGGKYVEAMPDVQVLLAPRAAADVKAALSRLRIAPLLDGVRGEPPLDVDAFCDAVLAVARVMADPGAGVVNLDLNPVLVGARGEGCVALDAVVYANSKS
ncbi:MAG TPA: acetate--CoA ligase family protein [Burkholderiales bacterium]|jgi:acyl-CoA synthetase (NDP forming)|nr:acetate--CoA ligase family protein [Burkholderiales bacterium]